MTEVKLSLQSIQNDKALWEEKGFVLPSYDIEKVRANTKENPEWVHFGGGNIFRAFPARIQDEILDEGLADTGVIIFETFGAEKLDYIFGANDNLSTAVTLKSDGTVDLRVVGAIAETVKATKSQDWARAEEIFAKESLKVVSFTITEKGYNIKGLDGDFTDQVKAEMKDKDLNVSNSMAIVAALLYHRFKNGAYPITMTSMDNCSHNGDKLKASVLDFAKAWVENGIVEKEFVEYLEDETKVFFPLSMIDKITPVADESIGKILKEKGYSPVESPIMDGRPQPPSYVNAEETEYLVIEESKATSYPAWDKKGIIFTDRKTVDEVETMKVTTCLNPLHTALAVYGCLLGYDLISAEMKDEDLVKLIKGVGYTEGMPVVVDPGIINPKEFIDTVLNVRFPNPFLPDAPQRIATDTSQKVAVRYGKTLNAYKAQNPEAIQDLKFIPAVIAGWLRYLLAIDDEGKAFEPSPDPMLASLQEDLKDVKFKDNEGIDDSLLKIIGNEEIFGIDLVEIGLADKIIADFKEMNKEEGAVRKFLQSL